MDKTCYASEGPVQAVPLSMSTISERGWYDAAKPALDFALALLLFPFALPVMLIVGCAVVATTPGPAVLVQRRLGIGGSVFKMYKFRTMRVDAEAHCGAVFAETNDPRLTTVGRVLRKYRLDELPQLINVLKGEMSFIGPRPERPEIAVELTKALPRFGHRLAVRPGITGLAQITVGYVSCVKHYRHKLALDLIYVKNRCLALDLKIALQTLLVLIHGEGAR